MYRKKNCFAEINLENYPLKIARQSPSISTIHVRSRDNEPITEMFGSDNLKSTYINDAIKAWNVALTAVKNCKLLFSAQKEIRKFVTSIPT